MKREYSIETNERKIYPLGVTKTQGGFDVAFVSEKSPALLLFEKGSRKRMARLAFPENARIRCLPQVPDKRLRQRRFVLFDVFS